MIWHPLVGQRVTLRYAAGTFIPSHRHCGEVLVVARGPGPINALVRLDDGRRVVVPRGNLVKEKA